MVNLVPTRWNHHTHTAQELMNCLRPMFPRYLISDFGYGDKPSRSPDLTVPDLFLWRYLKPKVYVNKPDTIIELKEHTADEIKQLMQHYCKKF
jgi:hypothetical protein